MTMYTHDIYPSNPKTIQPSNRQHGGLLASREVTGHHHGIRIAPQDHRHLAGRLELRPAAAD